MFLIVEKMNLKECLKCQQIFVNKNLNKFLRVGTYRAQKTTTRQIFLVSKSKTRVSPVLNDVTLSLLLEMKYYCFF